MTDRICTTVHTFNVSRMVFSTETSLYHSCFLLINNITARKKNPIC